MHQEGCGLEQTEARTARGAPTSETDCCRRAEIGLEIIERLRLAPRLGECDLHSRGRTADGRRHRERCNRVAPERRKESAACRSHCRGPVPARMSLVMKYWKRKIELIESRKTRRLPASASGGNRVRSRHLPDWLQSGQDIGPGVGKENVGVKKVRAGKHVIHGAGAA